MLKIVEKSETKIYRFNCPTCNKTMEGSSDDLKFVRHYRWSAILKFDCPQCKETREIKDRAVKIESVYVEETEQEE